VVVWLILHLYLQAFLYSGTLYIVFVVCLLLADTTGHDVSLASDSTGTSVSTNNNDVGISVSDTQLTVDNVVTQAINNNYCDSANTDSKLDTSEYK